MSRESQAAWKAAGVLLASVAGIAAALYALSTWTEAIAACFICLGLAGILSTCFIDLRKYFLRRSR